MNALWVCHKRWISSALQTDGWGQMAYPKQPHLGFLAVSLSVQKAHLVTPCAVSTWLSCSFWALWSWAEPGQGGALQWTFTSPAELMAAHQRQGVYRIIEKVPHIPGALEVEYSSSRGWGTERLCWGSRRHSFRQQRWLSTLHFWSLLLICG